jgi:uncharacterized membrane protein
MRVTLKQELRAVAGLTGVLALLIIITGAGDAPLFLTVPRLVLGLIMVLLMPGYMLQAAFFPRVGDLDGLERLALSIGLSLASIPVLALMLEALGVSLRVGPIMGIEILYVAVISLAAWQRRRPLPEEERFLLRVNFSARAWWAAQDVGNRLLYLALILLLGVGIAAAAAITLRPGPAELYTEFYILGPEGLAEGYPRETMAGEPVSVTVGVVNHEAAEASYRIEVHSGDHLIGQVDSFWLDDGASWEQAVSFVPVEVNPDTQVEFWLFRDRSQEVYRRLRLWINVVEYSSTPSGL